MKYQFNIYEGDYITQQYVVEAVSEEVAWAKYDALDLDFRNITQVEQIELD